VISLGGRFGRYVGLAIVLSFYSYLNAIAQNATTFEITVSLPSPTMHVGEDLVFETITSNRTDHVVWAGEGYGAGISVELLNEKGEDIGKHAMGGAEDEPVVVIHSSNKVSLRPGSSQKFTVRYKPEPGYLVPGVYKLRLYRRDMSSRAEVYSNTVVLTVVP